MHPSHEHQHGTDAGAGVDIEQLLVLGTAVLAVSLYLAAAGRLRRRGDAWPWRRDACFAAGGTALAVAVAVPLPGGAFTVHMAQHLLAGMVAPLLLVMGVRLASSADEQRRYLEQLSEETDEEFDRSAEGQDD